MSQALHAIVRALRDNARNQNRESVAVSERVSVCLCVYVCETEAEQTIKLMLIYLRVCASGAMSTVLCGVHPAVCGAAGSVL